MIDIKKMLFDEPNAVSHLGDDVFLKIPLYESNESIEPIYIDIEKMKEIFSLPESTTWLEYRQIVKKLFGCTINSEKSTGKQCGWAYVDRQHDPLEIAMVGNIGSGRAYYTGKIFNVKGEKTPFAVSELENHSNGFFSLKDAFWSTIISNTLTDEMQCGPAPILTILVFQENNTEYKNAQEIRTKIIRLNEDGKLDRPTHLKFSKKQISEDIDLRKIAENYGLCEAEKFIHRVLHGAWSSGNISLTGHIIDCDTVCAVKGRHPQFSETITYPDNYFGFEFLGQEKILSELSKNATSNPSSYIDFFNNSIFSNISKKIPYLMGFENTDTVYDKFKERIGSVAKTFMSLSRYTRFASHKCLYTNNSMSLKSHLFDFSAFFSRYVLLKACNEFSIEACFEGLAKSKFEVLKKDVEGSDSQYQFLNEKLKDTFSSYLIVDDSRLDELKLLACQFIADYDQLFIDILNDTKENIFRIFQRAYFINQDRFYLLPPFSLDFHLPNWIYFFDSHVICKRIQLIIDSSIRNPEIINNSILKTDIRIFPDGQSHIAIDQSGFFQVVFLIKKTAGLSTGLSSDDVKINLFSCFFSAEISDSEDQIMIMSERISIKTLLDFIARDDVFLPNKYSLYIFGEKINFSDFYGVDDKSNDMNSN